MPEICPTGLNPHWFLLQESNFCTDFMNDLNHISAASLRWPVICEWHMCLSFCPVAPCCLTGYACNRCIAGPSIYHCDLCWHLALSTLSNLKLDRQILLPFLSPAADCASCKRHAAEISTPSLCIAWDEITSIALLRTSIVRRTIFNKANILLFGKCRE